MFKNICIIGCGLIGSSLLRAIKKKNISQKISACDNSKSVLSFLKQQNLADLVTENKKDAIKDADLIIIATPLSSYSSILQEIKDSFPKGIIVTDTGSVKSVANKLFMNLENKDISWIPSHPIAGTEESGPQAGFAEIFENRWSIISPANDSKKEDVEKLENFWKNIGCKVKLMDCNEHDEILSITSHLPHAIAYSLVKTALGNDEKLKQEIIKYSAGGLRDFTRIASSDPIMWRDIFIDNSENVIKILESFNDNLKNFKKALVQKNSKELEKLFKSTKNLRKEIVDAGQDINKPDFGRKKN